MTTSSAMKTLTATFLVAAAAIQVIGQRAPPDGPPSSALPLANTTYTFGNNGTTSLNLRVQRNF